MAFLGAQNSGAYTPADVERKRRLAEMLAGKDIVSQEPFGALAEGLIGARSGYEGQQANEIEQQGISSANQNIAQMLSDPNVTIDKLIGENGAGNAWANSSQQAIIQSLLGKKMDQMYPDMADAGYFGSTIPYVDADGNFQYHQLSKDGLPKLPPGAHWLEPTNTVNTGTNQTVVGRNTGGAINAIPIENEQAAFDKGVGDEMGSAAGKAAVAAPGDIAAGEMAINLIDQIRNDPRLPGSTGIGPAWGTNDPKINPQGAGFQSIVEQAKSGAFLTAIQQMRGLGALSNAEGAAATAAVTRLSTNLEDADFKKALDDYQHLVELGIDRAKRRVRVTEDGREIPADGQVAPSATQQGRPVPVANDADYQALPKGTEYVDPDGNIRVKK